MKCLKLTTDDGYLYIDEGGEVKELGYISLFLREHQEGLMLYLSKSMIAFQIDNLSDTTHHPEVDWVYIPNVGDIKASRPDLLQNDLTFTDSAFIELIHTLKHCTNTYRVVVEIDTPLFSKNT